jgi:Sulfotransferase family
MATSLIAAPDAIVEQAREQTGLTDLGADGWQEGLDHLVGAVDSDLPNDRAAAALIERTAVTRLVNRLRVEDWYAKHGDEAAEQVVGPVMIIGLPRTATTALHYLLTVDDQFRYQRRWELVDPVPPPDIATESEDVRRIGAEATPSAQHIATADGPAEDVIAGTLNFGHQEFGFPIPTYTRWWRTSNLATTYAYHERLLRLLQSHRPPSRWLLRAPAFSFHLSQIAAQYPNARFIWTHRDPVVSIPSACSVIKTSQEMIVPSHRVDPAALGKFVLEHYIVGMSLAMAARAVLGESRFVDVQQSDLDAHPIETAERIYDFLGLELNDATRTAMTRWSDDNRKGVRGDHKYTPDEFGLFVEDIGAVFRGYTERFGIVPDSRS